MCNANTPTLLANQRLHKVGPSGLFGRRLVAVLGGCLADVTTATKALEVFERPRIAAPAKGGDVIDLSTVAAARRTTPVGGVQDPTADMRPSSLIQA